MLKIFVFIVFAACLFSLAAAGSWFMLNSGEDLTEEAAADEQPATDAAEPPVQKTTTSAFAAADMPPVSGDRSMSAEEIFRFGATFRKQREAFKKQQDSLGDERSRLNLIRDDIAAEQRELDGMLAQINDTLKSGESLLDRIMQDRANLENEQKQAQQQLEENKTQQTVYDSSQLVNVKKISSWFQSMPPDKAADVLRELSNDGKIDSAIQLLGNIEERDAAKILVAMDDPGLVVQLTERFKGLKQPEKKQRR